ncbi:MAG: hypothetical protein AAGK04_06705 [Planctomycetota bacterium]
MSHAGAHNPDPRRAAPAMASIVVMAAMLQLTLGLDRSDAVRFASSTPMSLRTGVECVRVAVASIASARAPIASDSTKREQAAVETSGFGRADVGHGIGAGERVRRGEGALAPPATV